MAEVSTQPAEKLWESKAPLTSGRTSRDCACTPVGIWTPWDPEYHLSCERGTCPGCQSYGSVVMTYQSYDHNCRPGRDIPDFHQKQSYLPLTSETDLIGYERKGVSVLFSLLYAKIVLPLLVCPDYSHLGD